MNILPPALKETCKKEIAEQQNIDFMVPNFPAASNKDQNSFVVHYLMPKGTCG